MRKKVDTGDSLVWKHMMINKHRMEPHIHQKINFGTCSFWQDNWLGVGPLAHFKEVSSRLDNTKVEAFIQNGQWDIEKDTAMAPLQHVAAILATQLQIQDGVLDKTM